MQRPTVVKAGIFSLAVLVLTLLITHPAVGETNPEKIKNIRKLLVVSGIQEQLTYMKEGVLNSYSQMISAAYPKVPDAFWTDFNELVGKKDMDALIDQVVPVYDKHMSNEVIVKLNEMFATPFWKEWREKMPVISREAGIAGQKWLHQITQSENFKKKIDRLVEKHELEKLNTAPKNPK
jgi:uncharacterized protein DUF2059